MNIRSRGNPWIKSVNVALIWSVFESPRGANCVSCFRLLSATEEASPLIGVPATMPVIPSGTYGFHASGPRADGRSGISSRSATRLQVGHTEIRRAARKRTLADRDREEPTVLPLTCGRLFRSRSTGRGVCWATVAKGAVLHDANFALLTGEYLLHAAHGLSRPALQLLYPRFKPLQ